MKGSFRSNGGGGSQPYNGKWAHHWGVDISTYDEVGYNVLLVSDSMLTAFFSTTATSTTTVSVYGKSGLLDTLTYTNNGNTNPVIFDPSIYSDSFDDPCNNGYGTYVLKTNCIKMQMSTRGIGTSPHAIGALWIILNRNEQYFNFLYWNPFMHHLEAIHVSSGYIVNYFTGNASRTPNLLSVRSTNGYQYTTEAPVNIYNGSFGIVEVPDTPTYALGGVTTYLANWYNNCYNLKSCGMSAWVSNEITTLNSTFANCYSMNEAINITSTSLTNFGANANMRSVPSIEVNAPLTLFVVNNAYSCKKLRVLNSNFKSLGSNTTVIDIRNMYAITEAELITFANNLEDLTGYVTKTISKAGTTNWTAAVTAILTAKNWTII